MYEKFEMKDGTIVTFYSALSYNGINVSVSTKLDKDQKDQFKKELKMERDVVSIRFE